MSPVASELATSLDPAYDEISDGRTLADRVPGLRPQSPVPTYAGIAVTAVGLVLIAFAWGKVAGLTNVALQMPYLVSGGLSGLALVMIGVTVINIAAKRRDAAAREQQTQLLASALAELRGALTQR
ncbi:MAG: hypothetical protein M3N21_00555 [Actinomycetota bacterium]|nr:hypothetical protein [Actinomycetota bacterium]